MGELDPLEKSRFVLLRRFHLLDPTSDGRVVGGTHVADHQARPAVGADHDRCCQACRCGIGGVPAERAHLLGVGDTAADLPSLGRAVEAAGGEHVLEFERVTGLRPGESHERR